MLSVFICEDNQQQREAIEDHVKKSIMIEEYEMELVLSTDNPVEVLEHVQNHPKETGLYFLDIDLGHKMNGIALASEIREIDDLGKIVFVTTHAEMSTLTFTYKIEAMDFIVKDNPSKIQERVQDCVHTAFKRYKNDNQDKKKILNVTIGDKAYVLNYDDIMFFETSTTPRKVVVHLDNEQLEYYEAIKNIPLISDDFYRCHKSYVVNKKNIKHVDKTTKEIELINGETCYVSSRFMKGLLT